MGCFGDCFVTPKMSEEPLKHDSNFQGPVENRSCTDVVWLIIFITYMILWILIGIYAITSGNIAKIIAPTDSNGQRCGLDYGLEDKKYLVSFSSPGCFSPGPKIGCRTLRTCVEQCPTETIYFDKALSTTPFEELKKKMICVREVVQTMTQSQALEYIKEGKCAISALKSQAALKWCMPDEPVDTAAIHDNETMLWGIMQEVALSRWYMLGALVVVVLVCFIYMLLLRWIAAPVVWASIIGFFVLFGFGIYRCCKLYQTDKENSNVWLLILIVMAVIMIIMIIVVIFLRGRILIAIALIQEGSKAVSAIISTIFFPILPWILLTLVTAYGFTVLIYLWTIGESTFQTVKLTDDTNCVCGQDVYTQDYVPCDPAIFSSQCQDKIQGGVCKIATCSFAGLNTSPIVIFLQIVNFFGYYWAVFFIYGVSDMILASAFATWYWTFEKKNLSFYTLPRGIYRTLRYHLGTVALGALILAIIKLIRTILEYLDEKFKGIDNIIARCLSCCCQYLFWCLENFIKFINKNVYIVCAIYGLNFCHSAKHAVSLLWRNIVNVIVLDKVLLIIFIISKLLISIGVGVAVYYLLHWNSGEKLKSGYVSAIITAIATFFICGIFFNVYAMAVDTIFLCFLEDSERNDGSPEKPYFMSTNLRKILDKRNQQRNAH